MGRGKGGGGRFTSAGKAAEEEKKKAAAVDRVHKELADLRSLGRQESRQRSITAKKGTWSQIKLAIVCLVALVKDRIYIFAVMLASRQR
jgi:cytochrome c biogenesis protein ResB